MYFLRTRVKKIVKMEMAISTRTKKKNPQGHHFQFISLQIASQSVPIVLQFLNIFCRKQYHCTGGDGP